MAEEFVNLHNHSHHGSHLDGYSSNIEYLTTAKELGQRGLGMSDHGTVHGMYNFINAAKEFDITAVPGVEFYVAPINPEGAFAKQPIFYNNKSKNDVSSAGAYLHLTVWAYNADGMYNLFKLVTASNSPDRYYKKPRIDFNLLADHSDGLVVSTGCPSSEISTRFLNDQDDKAYEYASRLKDVFQDNLYVEIMDHSMNIDLERSLLPKQLKLSKDLGIPLLATNDCHYAKKENHLAHEEMLCSQSGSKMSDETYGNGGKRFAFTGTEYYLKSAAEMAKMFPASDFPGALSNSLRITEQAQDLKLDYNPNLMAQPVVPEQFKDSADFYKYLLKKGLKDRYGNASDDVKREAMRRMKYEFKVIHSSNFVDYLLVVREYLNWAKESYSTRNASGDILAPSIGPGRGSVGGSIHAYLLGISEVDPIKHDLIFERFLSAGRGDTYRVTYDDGTYEDVIVSTERTVIKEDGTEERKYIHQLKVGDTVEEENETDE